MKNFQVMIFNGLILILLGLYGFLLSLPEKRSFTAFIGPGIGLILILLSLPARKGKSVPSHIAIVLTFLVVIVFFYAGFRRENSLIIISAVISFICLIFYGADFAFRKKEREENSKNE